ncbi:hypothetical protein GCM10011571_20910 [Marinithermofilum abyssi]|uniref:Uncharacterized protein n=1 Tax=Marinithermofilum abyssi TaxID=1571185 RepID=A0A8J2Y9B3_9BACL|nr:hypothetical protein [Marinithermofilum abyssi]GGE18790.1 hypothetical protein GCM10011571_20910 [Marinithermofilum abyssi]
MKITFIYGYRIDKLRKQWLALWQSLQVKEKERKPHHTDKH